MPPVAVLKIDGRSRPGRRAHALRLELVARVGGRPDAAQRALIDRAAQLQLRIALLAEQFSSSGEQGDTSALIGLVESLSRLLSSPSLGAPCAPAHA